MVQIGAPGEGNEITGATRGYTFNFPSGTDMITPGTTVLFISEECETSSTNRCGNISQLLQQPAWAATL